MNNNTLLEKHSTDFVNKWSDIIADVFKWEKENNFFCIPNLTRTSYTYSYLPLLSYTDISVDKAKTLSNVLSENKKHIVRCISQEKDKKSSANEPVVMRLNLKGLSKDDVWNKKLDSYCRNRIRKSFQQDYEIRKGNDNALLKDAYSVFLKIMHRLGTPAWPFSLLEKLAESGLAQVYVVYKNNKPVSMLVLISDHNIAWVPWCGAIASEMPFCPNYLSHWEAIQDSIEQGSTIFDFGRSPFGGGTYRFKKKWGAEPCPLEYISNLDSNLYSKYKIISELWKLMPAFFVNLIGPKICRYLPEL